jgi:acetyl esterase/lipase
MAQTVTPVPYDPEVLPALQALQALLPDVVTLEVITAMREGSSFPQSNPLLEDGTVVASEHTVTSEDGHEIVLTRYARADHQHGPGAVYWIHGGGLIVGDRFSGIDIPITWVAHWDLVVVTVEYRLAPEFRYPVPLEDCYRGLEWFAERAEEFGFDTERLVVAGGSAGGNLAAAVTLAARDRQGPAIMGQLLLCPMLDDRNETVSSWQYTGKTTWSRESNLIGWNSYLGEARGSADVPYLAAPARLTDFSGLPTTFLDAGSAEVFRDEIVAYATGLWAAGIQAELHIWAGGFHGFAGFAPQAAITQQSSAARDGWLQRLFGVS